MELFSKCVLWGAFVITAPVLIPIALVGALAWALFLVINLWVVSMLEYFKGDK